jgi:hypothetical protein
MNIADRLQALFREIASEIEANPSFAHRLKAVLEDDSAPVQVKGQSTALPSKRRPHRRTPGVLDPFAIYAEGNEPALRTRLEDLELERLKDIVAEYSMDPAKLAMKWRTKGRLIDLIVNTIRERDRKGDAFRAEPLAQDSQTQVGR